MRLKARRIIGEAWEFTQNNKRLISWYAFLPALLSTLFGILYVAYQYFSFVNSPLFGQEQTFLAQVALRAREFVENNGDLLVPFVIVVVILGVLYLLIPSFCEGAIIQIIARKRNGQDVRMRDGIRYGMMSFLPIFEYSWLVRTFSLVSVFTWAGFLARNLGWDALNAFTPILIVYFIVGLIVAVVFTYTEFFIVIDDRKVLESISKSSVLVMTHLEETLLLSILMLIISVRILLQIVFVLLIPGAMLLIIYLFASASIPLAAFVLAGAVGLALLYIASYLNATIHVFAASVWTFTFLELTTAEMTSARDKPEDDSAAESTV